MCGRSRAAVPRQRVRTGNGFHRARRPCPARRVQQFTGDRRCHRAGDDHRAASALQSTQMKAPRRDVWPPRPPAPGPCRFPSHPGAVGGNCRQILEMSFHSPPTAARIGADREMADRVHRCHSAHRPRRVDIDMRWAPSGTGHPTEPRSAGNPRWVPQHVRTARSRAHRRDLGLIGQRPSDPVVRPVVPAALSPARACRDCRTPRLLFVPLMGPGDRRGRENRVPAGRDVPNGARSD